MSMTTTLTPISTTVTVAYVRFYQDPWPVTYLVLHDAAGNRLVWRASKLRQVPAPGDRYQLAGFVKAVRIYEDRPEIVVTRGKLTAVTEGVISLDS